MISVDVRGRGDSNWGPPTEYLNQNYVTDLAKMLEELGVARASLIGTSMGGIISMMYAGGWTDRVDRLVINDIGPEIDPAGMARIASYVGTAPERFKDIGEVVKYYKENYPAMAKLPDNVVADQVKWSVKPGTDGALLWKMDPNVRRPLARRHCAAALRFMGAVCANRMPDADRARRGQRYPGPRHREPDVQGAQAREGCRGARSGACAVVDGGRVVGGD